MRKQTKRIISKILLVVTVVTSVGYAPPPVLASQADIKALMDDLASPSEAVKPGQGVSTPSQPEKASPSESQKPKRFIKIEPDEIPEYYSQVSVGGKKLWSFEDRNGIIRYRNYGYIQGDVEFPSWQEADNQGIVEKDMNINVDEEYYELAPLLFEAENPKKSNWIDLSWRMFSDPESIFTCQRQKSKEFENWDGSSYFVWFVNKSESNENKEEIENLGYYFFGQVKNEKDPILQWYYADENGKITDINDLIQASLLKKDSYTWYLDAPGTLRSIKGTTNEFTGKRTLGSRNDNRTISDFQKEHGLDIRSTLIGWSGYRVKDNSLWDGYNNLNGDPAKTDIYHSGGTLYSPSYELDSERYHSRDFYALWCPNNADAYIFLGEAKDHSKRLEYFMISDVSFDLSGVVVRRNKSFDVGIVSKPQKAGYQFQGWTEYDAARETVLNDGDQLYCGEEGKVRWVYPVFTPNTNTVQFLDYYGNLLKEETVISGYAATAPTPPEIPGMKFMGWDQSYNNITSDKIVKPKYETFCIVTFEANGGEFNVGEPQPYITNIKKGDIAYDICKQTENIVSKKGYTFDGWYDNPEGTGSRLATFSTITEDTTFYAKWRRNTYYLYYYKNIPGKEDQYTYEDRVSYGDPYGELRTFEELGYKFLGWFTERNGGEQVTSETIMGDSFVYLYGHWEKLYFDLTLYDGIPGSSWTETRHLWVGDGLKVLRDIKTDDRLGYLNGGWYTGPNKTGESFGSSDEVKTSTLTLYKAWKPKSVIVRFHQQPSDTSQWKYSHSNYDQPIGELPVPPNPSQQKGKIFTGWFTEPYGGDKVIEGSITKGTDLETSYPEWILYAHWANPENTVVFKDWDGTELKNEIVAFGEDAIPPEVEPRAGYRFIGWDKDCTNIQEDTVLTAQYKISTRQLTLDANGGTISKAAALKTTVNIDESFDPILTDHANQPTRNYYTFTGWYSAPSGGTRCPESGNIMPDTDLTVYAQWERSSSEVTFKDWDGTILSKQEVAIGADATLPNEPKRAGYTFDSWDKSTSNIRDHITVTAQYTANGYILTLDANGGALEESAQKDYVVSFDQSFDQILKDGERLVNRTGYSFDGWYTSAVGGTSYLYTGNLMPAINVTVFAHWTPNTYKVTFNPDHARWTGGATTEEHTFDTKLGTLPAPEIYGWKFTGWWTGKNGTGIRVTDQSMVDAKDVVYYGAWEPETYQIRFVSKAEQSDGESVKTVTVNQKYDGSFGTLPVPEEKGYTFWGWYDEDHKKIDSNTIFKPDSNADKSVYYAKWKANNYQIRFGYTDHDGKPVIKIIDATYGGQIGSLPEPEKPGYTFLGWFDENGDEITADSWVDPGKTEYTARWEANQYVIHFEKNLTNSENLEDPDDKTVTYALPIGELPYIKEPGYIFLGWFTEPDGGKKIKETTLAALGDQTYYGHWSIGIIDNGDGTHKRPGTDGRWNTSDDELWWNGLDGNPQTLDDKKILKFPNSLGTYADNGDGTHYRPGKSGRWNDGVELWWNGADGLPGTEDDLKIYRGGNGTSGIPIYYIDFGNGIYIRPGKSGNWENGAEHWWYGPDGKPGTGDDRQIHVLPGGGYYIDNGDGTYIKPGPGGSWSDGSEHWWYGPDGEPGTGDDRQIHVLPGGGYYIDNGDGTYIKPGPGGSWSDGSGHWWYGPDGKPGTGDDRQIHVLPGGGYYIDNGDGTYIKPGPGGSWSDGTEHWSYGPDGKPGTPDDYKIIDDPEPVKPEPVDPEPVKPEPVKPEPVEPEPVKPEPVKPEPVNPSPNEPAPEEGGGEDKQEIVTLPTIDSTLKPNVQDDGGTFNPNPQNPLDVTYTKPDGSTASNEWIGDGTDYYHINEESKVDYDWFLNEDGTWYMLNNKPGEKFGAALRGWYGESMDDKKYFFNPGSTKMLTGWQNIDNKWYFFTPRNEGQTYFGSNKNKWKYDPLRPGKPYGSMYQSEQTPDGCWVNEYGVYVNK